MKTYDRLLGSCTLLAGLLLASGCGEAVAADGHDAGTGVSTPSLPSAHSARDDSLALARHLADADPSLRRLLSGNADHAFVSHGGEFVSARWDAHDRDRFRRVSVQLPARASDTVTAGLGRIARFDLRITLEGAADVAGSLHDGATVYAGAYRSTDVIWSSRDDRAEELLVLRDAGAPLRFAWHVDLPRGLGETRREDGGALLFTDRHGGGVLRVPTPFVVDARGTRHPAVLEWTGRRLTVSVDPSGLEYPLLLDPAVEVVLWEKMTPRTTTPPARFGHAMTYDSASGLTVMYGGQNATVQYANTWGWDGKDWSLIEDTTSPARSGVSMAYDSVADASIMFGSCSAETWQLSGSTWSLLSPKAAPSSRRYSAMAYDGPPSAGGRGKTVLFGGHQCVTPEEDVGDTWEWDGANWSPLSPDPSPDAREAHAMVYETKRHKTLLFGGFGAGTTCCSGLNDCMRSDTWTWDGSQWEKQTPAKSPPGRYVHAMAYDSAANRTVMYGGNSCPFLEDTWEWDGTTWTDVSPSTGPGLRQQHAMAYDPARGRVVLFAGQSTSIFNDTWEFHSHGAACASDSECDTGHCVDGVCCEQSACGTCEACDTLAKPGQCAPVQNAQDDTCNGANACDASGVCQVFQGKPCTTSCPTGLYCVDGVCCNTACTGQCEACDVTNLVGTCSAVSGAPHGTHGACAGNDPACVGTCNGTLRSACTYPDTTTSCRTANCTSGTQTLAAKCDGAGTCPAAQTSSCGLYACGATACLGTCTDDTACAGNAFCSGSSCTPKLDLGSACTRTAQCKSGNCVDGYCCDSGCSGQCEACDVTGSKGTCSAVSGAPHGTARGQCADDGTGCGGTCDGTTRASCTYPGGSKQCRAPTCTSGVATAQAFCDGAGACPALQTVACAPFQCGATQCAGCANDGECATTEYCLAGVCKAKLPAGSTCTAVDQCTSGACTDGVCCDRACASQCEACDVTGSVGTCKTVASGPPHGTRTRCTGTGQCTGTCDGTSATACAFPKGVQCASGFCTNGTETAPSTCDGSGNCAAGTTRNCGAYVCGNGACKTTCSVGPDCQIGYWCASGQCVAIPVGGAGGGGGSAGASAGGAAQGGSAGSIGKGGTGGTATGGSVATGGVATGGRAGAGAPDAAVGGAQTDAGGSGGSHQSSGCGCRIGNGASGSAFVPWLALVFAVYRRRRARGRQGSTFNAKSPFPQLDE